MPNSKNAYIALGSNLGDKKKYIDSARKALSENKNIKIVDNADLIETEPLGKKLQEKFLNTVTKIQTSLSPNKLLEEMLEIENYLNRQRKRKWAPRTIDLDLLLYDNRIINTPDLKVPHPRMHLRSFVLEGLSQIDRNLIHPTLGETVSVLAQRLNGCNFTLNSQLPQLFCFAGIIGVGKTTLTKKVCECLSCKKILEPYAKNPFLPKVYAGQKDLSLNSQLFFLTSRVEQLKPEALKPGLIAVSDYIFQKELIYARTLLDKVQLNLYRRVYPYFADMATNPVLVIYLTDTPRNCLLRIHKRNRSYEQNIKVEFLESLRREYQKLFSDWTTSPLIRLSIPEKNPQNQNNFKNLINQIKHYIIC